MIRQVFSFLYLSLSNEINYNCTAKRPASTANYCLRNGVQDLTATHALRSLIVDTTAALSSFCHVAVAVKSLPAVKECFPSTRWDILPSILKIPLSLPTSFWLLIEKVQRFTERPRMLLRCSHSDRKHWKNPSCLCGSIRCQLQSWKVSWILFAKNSSVAIT